MTAPARRSWMIALLVGAALVMFVVGVWRATGPGTPRYSGQDVYYWMFQTRSSSLDDNAGLKAIGSNAVPHLTRALAIRSTIFDRLAWVRKPPVQRSLSHLPVGFTWTRDTQTVRRQAAFSLLTFEAEARSALPELHAALADPTLENGTRQMVVSTLLEIGLSGESVPHLLAAWPLTTNDTSSAARHDLVLALSRVAQHAPDGCLPIFLAELEAPDENLRLAAAWGASSLGSKAHAATPALLRLLASTNGYSQFTAIVALGKVTSALPEVLPQLRELAHGSDDRTAAGAALTLWRWGEPVGETVATLTGLLSKKGGKGLAAEYLGVIGRDAASAVPALIEASQKDIGAWVDRYDRARCAIAVLQIAGRNEVANKELEAALSFSGNSWVRGAVARDLGRQGRLAEPLLPALRQNLRDTDIGARNAAAAAIESIEQAWRKVPELEAGKR